MHNQRTYLPDVWAGGFVAAIPVSQANTLVSELKASSDIRCIFVEEELQRDQDWLELVIQTIEDKFSDDLYVSSSVESLACQNNTSISNFGLRRRTLKNLLRYLSQDKKVLIYITYPLRNLQDPEFMHLAHLIDDKIGIYCHVINERDVPVVQQSMFRYQFMNEIINPDNPVYISYSRVDSTSLVKTIVKRLEQEGISVKLDMRDNGPGNSIKEFENEIGKASNVIVILSDEYFQSHDCMYEMALIAKSGNIPNRVTFIDGLKTVTRARMSHDLIKDQWTKKFDEYRNVTPTDSVLIEQMKEIGLICQYISDFWKYLDDLVAFSRAEVETDEAYRLAETIKEQLSNIHPPLDKQFIDPLNDSSAPTHITKVTQTGRHAVSVGVINGDVHFH